MIYNMGIVTFDAPDTMNLVTLESGTFCLATAETVSIALIAA